MKDQVVSLFQTYPFLQTEWFYTCLAFILSLNGAIIAAVLWRIDTNQKKIEERKQRIVKEVEIDITMKHNYRKAWMPLIATPGDAHKEIFDKDIREIESDEVRAGVFTIIDILDDTFCYYRKLENPLDERWFENIKYTFNPKKRKVFVSAFDKYAKSHKLDKEFISLVKKVIEQHKNNDQESISNEENEEVA